MQFSVQSSDVDFKQDDSEDEGQTVSDARLHRDRM